jgi:hypothetical protein
MDDDDGTPQLTQIVFVLKSLIGGDKDIEICRDFGQENVIPESLPAKIECCLYVMADQNLCDACVTRGSMHASRKTRRRGRGDAE